MAMLERSAKARKRWTERSLRATVGTGAEIFPKKFVRFGRGEASILLETLKDNSADREKYGFDGHEGGG